MKAIILDTNAYTRLLAGDENVLDIVASAETVYMSIFVLGELHAGFISPVFFHYGLYAIFIPLEVVFHFL